MERLLQIPASHDSYLVEHVIAAKNKFRLRLERGRNA